MAGSQVVTKAGMPRVVYHRTASEFEAFDTTRGDLGTHFGTAEHARNLHAGNLRDGERTIAVYLKLCNPLRLKDVGNFHADAVAPQLRRLGLIDRETEQRLFAAGDRGGTEQRRLANTAIKAILTAHGYDGVVYKNTNEGRGDSYIAFRPDQIRFALCEPRQELDAPTARRREVCR